MKKISVFAFVLLSAVNAANNRPISERFYEGSPSDPDTPISCDSDSVVSTSSEKCLTYYFNCLKHNGKYLEVGDSSEGRLIFFEQNGHTLEEYWDTLAALMYSCLFFPDRPYILKQKGTAQLMFVDCMTLRKKATNNLDNTKQLCQFNRRPLANIKQADVMAAKLAETGSIITLKTTGSATNYGLFPFDRDFFDSVGEGEYIKTTIRERGGCAYSTDGIGVDQKDQDVRKAADKFCRFGADGQLSCRANQGINAYEYNLKNMNPNPK
ncbi:unnamed protein product [Bursaphelenchus xylophilus]|uniref:(pine wood nematode) hypothetical protein n=1 Tax=Bursaphelenchus xylophilus TaxID=6326 RepID=A0A1I7RKM6_BURXY|nr:unnamed protein product [Bursaphelenchus xylophilus]CAG9131222.1 unnamed protein product [Bursaphelenchus xylophilus]